MTDATTDTDARPALAVLEGGETLAAHGLGKSYGAHRVLRDVSLEARRGESFGLFGPNGAGKTTCFRILAGALAADEGAVRLGGQEITRLPMHRRARIGLAYLPQQSSVFRALTVEQNILAALELSEPLSEARREQAEALMADFGLLRLREAAAGSLSGGERRRTEIARALATDPRFVLLDEPLAGIDPITISEIREMIAGLKDRGLGVLITDHNIREALEMADRAAILHDGRVLVSGRPRDLVEDEGARRVYLGAGFRL